VDEAEWWTCNDPEPMLKFLEGKGSKRKIRLFGLACCRRLWHLLPTERWRKLIEVGERFVDGSATRAELNTVWWWISTVATDEVGEQLLVVADKIGCVDLTPSKAQALAYAAAKAVAKAANAMVDVNAWKCPPRDAERKEQAHLLRDCFGDPFRTIPSIHTDWLAWHASTIPKLAQAIYDERAFDRLPILADALEDAGCENADILSHCRSSGPHVRGCWFIDLLLGKE